MPLPEVVIIDSVRTAIGKLGGTLQDETVDKLAATTIQALIERTNIDTSLIDEVIIGQAKQSADTSNLARYASLKAGLPIEIPSYTVHRQCGSGLQAIHNAQQQIQLGLSNVIIAGGAESMSTAPYYIRHARFGYRSGNGLILDPNTESQVGSQPYDDYGIQTMGETAENLAKKYNISREEQDIFSYNTQKKATTAINDGLFKSQVVPYPVKQGKVKFDFQIDEHPRLSSVDMLASLKPVFQKDGTVTAGNSSGRNDGASMLLLMNREFAEHNGFEPKARIVSQAACGVDPRYMGIGPVPAIKKALKLANLNINDIDIIELNEAFAAQALAVIKELDLDMNKVNPVGGAIALGHPIGATGAILMTKLVHELERTKKRYGIVTLCIAGGLGIATIIENLSY